MKKILFILTLIISFSILGSDYVEAKSSSFRSSGRSSFRSSPSRSYSRPAPKRINVNRTVNRTYNNNLGGGDSSGGFGGFFTGMLMGNMLSSNHQAPVVVQQPAPQYIQQQAQAPQAIGAPSMGEISQEMQQAAPTLTPANQEEPSSNNWFAVILLIILSGGLVFVLHKVLRRK